MEKNVSWRVCSSGKKIEMKDKLIRYLGAEEEYIVKVAVTTRLVAHAQKIGNYGENAIVYLGNLLTGALLMEDSVKDSKEKLTLDLEGDGPLNKVVAIADSKGNVKGFAAKPTSTGGIGNGFLGVTKDQGLKTPYRTTMPLVIDDVENNLMYYYAGSEQLPTFFSLGVALNKKKEVAYSYGYMVQALPFVKKEITEKIADNIGKGPSKKEILARRLSPEEIASHLLEGLSRTKTEEKEVRFHCGCSKRKALASLKKAGKNELEAMVKENKSVKVICGSCLKKYEYSIDEIKSLLGD